MLKWPQPLTEMATTINNDIKRVKIADIRHL